MKRQDFKFFFWSYQKTCVVLQHPSGLTAIASTKSDNGILK
ncbi:hypothetical protein HMPREF9441_03397 [Paraprevotella clara YIT 11840]|uniref:Uncharacterized protein n=1 Tax=Paraprevotella clara YIT 11840 TaxID=762968 RepID=G5SV78_9BACT|nr:hypothetical protein HMPREF9441_03397 [Paraprevotella clara YIT 11840]